MKLKDLELNIAMTNLNLIKMYNISAEILILYIYLIIQLEIMMLALLN